jgi:hypothetical protein
MAQRTSHQLGGDAHGLLLPVNLGPVLGKDAQGALGWKVHAHVLQ